MARFGFLPDRLVLALDRHGSDGMEPGSAQRFARISNRLASGRPLLIAEDRR